MNSTQRPCHAGVFISARMKSVRLPKKQMREILGRPVTALLIERLRSARLPERLVMTTSTHPDDAVLAELAIREGIDAYRGSPEDRLVRYLRAAEQFQLDFVVIADGDDPFCDPEMVDETIRRYLKSGADYISCSGLPLGATCHGLKVEALRKVCELKDDNEPELWVGYFTETGMFKTELFEAEPALRRPDLRMTLDYPEDFEFFSSIFQHLYHPSEVFSLRQILDLLDRHPEIAALNSRCKEIYEKNLQRIRKPTILRARS